MATNKKTVKKTTPVATTAAVDTANTVLAEPYEVKKMDPKIKKLWVADLRSGKYKQTTGVLREIYLKNRAGGVKAGDVKGMCCLGVLADRFARSKANIHKFKWTPEMDDKWDEKTEDYIQVPTSTTQLDEEGSLMPQCVMDWAGFDEADPEVPLAPLFENKKYKKKLDDKAISGEYTTLAALNDGGFNFNDIADIIEKYL